MSCEWRRDDGFVVSDDPARLDIDTVHEFLSTSYWAQGIPREIVERSIANSLTFGIYTPKETGGELVGFARVITDRATFAYLADVFVSEAYRGHGLSKFLLQSILAHPEIQGLRRWMLMTRDAHGLYSQFGFAGLDMPENAMQLKLPISYGSDAALAVIAEVAESETNQL